MDDSPAGSIILFLLLIIASAYFFFSFISLASVNRIHMMSRASKGNKGAKRVLKILDNFDEALSVLLIGNNVVNIGCAFSRNNRANLGTGSGFRLRGHHHGGNFYFRRNAAEMLRTFL